MDVGEIIKKLAYHYQMAAAWDHFAKKTKEAAEDPMHHIPIEGGLTPTRVGNTCLEELQTFMQEKAQQQRQQIAQLTSVQASPIQLAENPEEDAAPEEPPAEEETAPETPLTEPATAPIPIRRPGRGGRQEQ